MLFRAIFDPVGYTRGTRQVDRSRKNLRVTCGRQGEKGASDPDFCSSGCGKGSPGWRAPLTPLVPAGRAVPPLRQPASGWPGSGCPVLVLVADLSRASARAA